MNSKELTREYYKSNHQQLTKKFNSYGAQIKDINNTFSYIDKTNPAIFELGCGNGRDALEIMKRTNKYLGIDYSDKFIEDCKKNISDKHFIQGDFESINFPDKLDGIFSIASLLHSSKESVQVILNKALSSLSNGGVIFLSLKYGRYREYLETNEFGARVFYFYTPNLIKTLAPSGLQIVKVRKWEFHGQKWFSVILQKK
jgi:SAM-dependent methyltransferase